MYVKSSSIIHLREVHKETGYRSEIRLLLIRTRFLFSSFCPPPPSDDQRCLTVDQSLGHIIVTKYLIFQSVLSVTFAFLTLLDFLIKHSQRHNNGRYRWLFQVFPSLFFHRQCFDNSKCTIKLQTLFTTYNFIILISYKTQLAGIAVMVLGSVGLVIENKGVPTTRFKLLFDPMNDYLPNSQNTNNFNDQYNYNSQAHYSQWGVFFWSFVIVLILGIIMAVTGFMGCFGAALENQCLMGTVSNTISSYLVFF